MALDENTITTSSTVASTTTWDECIGPAKWLNEPLQRILSYPNPLPVQQAVIPTITRALLSGVPNDVSLTAPTGSGKTLCYLVPLLRLLTETKRGVDDNALRCLILVPTQSLGQQVHRELQRLARPTSIRVACVCAEMTPGVHAAQVDATEANLLVRRVVLPRRPATCVNTKTMELALASSGVPVTTRKEEERIGGDDDWESKSNIESDSEIDASDDSSRSSLSDDDVNTDIRATRSGNTVAHVCRQRGLKMCYFSNVDVIVATPERLLHHLDHTRGLRLADLRLFVIDEADQVLVGNFASQVQKVNARYEYEVHKLQRDQKRRQEYMSAALRMRFAASGDMSDFVTSSASSLLRLHSSFCSNGVGAGTAILHKVLCSATLSSRIARISQVKLRNCSYYVLDSNGAERKEETTVVSTTAAADSGKIEGKANSSVTGAADAQSVSVRTQFALPPTLQEHVIFVEDSYRPAVLLKLVHVLRERIAAVQQQQSRAKAVRRTLIENRDKDEGEENDAVTAEVFTSDKGTATSTSTAAATMNYPSVEDRAGTGILVFCATAEEARVMSHFLAAAGITSVVEFTTLASEAERRRALLQRPTGTDTDDAACVVASDALMRGIDIPNIGHVIMYHPPDAVSQYVHRAGRTARAMRPGHVHLLLSKTGPSGTQEDGEMALYKRLSQSLSRTLPVSFERLFFRFAENPAQPVSALTAPPAAVSADGAAAAIATAASSTLAPAAASVKMSVAPTAGSAEWWVAQAEQFLLQSQHQLQRRWASVLECAAALTAVNAKKTAAVAATGAPVAAGATEVSKKSAVTSFASPSSTYAGASSSRKRKRPDSSKIAGAH